MMFLLVSSVQITAILIVALFSLRLLRKKSAAARHWVLSAAIVLAVVTPILTAVMPAWNMPDAVVNHPAIAPIQQQITRMTRPSADNGTAQAPVTPLTGSHSERPASAISHWLPEFVWSLGVAIGLVVLATGLVRLARVTSASATMAAGRWPQLVEQISTEYRLRRSVRLLQSLNCSILLTWGVLRPRIVLPAGAGDWPVDRARIVLRHELAHIRRYDWLVQMIAQLFRIVYWFNPLVWMVCRRLRLESECACDDAVVTGREAIEGHEYAAHLLDLARTLNRTNSAWSSALTMAQSSTIERRFSAMLNPALNRRPVTRWFVFATLLAGVLITLPLTMLSTATSTTAPLVVMPVPAALEAAAVETQAAPQAAPAPPVARTVPQIRVPEPGIQDAERFLEEYRSRLQNVLPLDLERNRNVNELLQAFISGQVQNARATRTQAQPIRPRDRALYEAAEASDLQEIDALISAGANVNAEVRGDGSPLIAAARRGRMEIVNALLDRGADPNMPVLGDGSPLIVASQRGHLAVVELLIRRGANIDQFVPGDGNPLIMAARQGHIDIVSLLLVARTSTRSLRVIRTL